MKWQTKNCQTGGGWILAPLSLVFAGSGDARSDDAGLDDDSAE